MQQRITQQGDDDVEVMLSGVKDQFEEVENKKTYDGDHHHYEPPELGDQM